MRLIIGGYAQGKLAYVIRTYGLDMEAVLDGTLPEKTEETLVVNHLHTWVKRRIADGGNPEEEIKRILENCPRCIVISDEVGSGIVPLEAEERAYRERMGRILVRIAKQAESVERVFCGIGQRIK